MLSKERIVQALEALDRELAARHVRGEVCLVGGAVMSLVYDARPSTRDVDAWFAPAGEIRDAAARVAKQLQLSADWLNDAAKGFLSEHAGFVCWRSLPNLEIRVADAKTMLAMKCLAARTDQDAEDIRVLSSVLDLTSAAAILDTVAQYYDPGRIHVRTQLLLEELFDADGN